MDATNLIYILSLSMITQKVSSSVVKTIPEDQEYAEHYFLHPDEKADDTVKTCLRNEFRNNTNVCDISPALFMEMCKEVVEIETLRTLYTMFILDYDQIPEPCQNCTVKLYRTKTSENVVYHVQARSCPTLIGGHPLWVSKGYEVGSIFVYNENYISDEKLRLEDYIIFVDTTDEPMF